MALFSLYSNCTTLSLVPDVSLKSIITLNAKNYPESTKVCGFFLLVKVAKLWKIAGIESGLLEYTRLQETTHHQFLVMFCHNCVSDWRPRITEIQSRLLRMLNCSSSHFGYRCTQTSCIISSIIEPYAYYITLHHYYYYCLLLLFHGGSKWIASTTSGFYRRPNHL